MGKNNCNLTKEQRKEIRYQRARRWLGNYHGGRLGIIKAYKAHFKLDHDCACRDILDMGLLRPAFQEECRREEAARREKATEEKRRRRNAAA